MPEKKYNYTTNIFSVEAIDNKERTPGFVKESVVTTAIKDGDSLHSKDYAALNKMCTSIPTPFARLFLFNTAFREVIEEEEKTSNDGSNNHGLTLRNKTLYHYLVADCLDMLEFIFYYGARPEFNVVEWNRDNELRIFDGTTYEPHKRLQDGLHNHLFDDDTLRGLNTLYLFTWNTDPENPDSVPIVVGGISPFSLVYTSPNWVRLMKEKNLSFPAAQSGRMLFDNDPSRSEQITPLMDRSAKFKAYMYRLYFANGHLCPSLREFWKYIQQCWEYYNQENDNEMRTMGVPGNAQNYTPIRFENDYSTRLHSSSFGDNGRVTELQLDPHVMGIKIRCNALGDARVHDDYKIRIDHLPQEHDATGVEIEVLAPLVLDKDNDFTGAQYVDGEVWSAYKNNMPAYNAISENYWERTLPGKQRQYPYLRKEDLLEDKIIRLAGIISKKQFLTGSTGNVTFLPPLKRTFFKFFKYEDIFELGNDDQPDFSTGVPQIKNDLYSFAYNPDRDEVTVTLRIPIIYEKQYVILTKTYHPEDIVDLDDQTSHCFDLSIFPFYKLLGDGDQYNKYSVMLGYQGNIDLNFYKFNDLNNTISGIKVEKRTASDNICTRYYTIDESFDIIEVTADDAHGIVLPLFKRTMLGADTMIFCVDLGTTNTHVAFAKDGLKTVDNPEDLYYGNNNDQQMVSLFDEGYQFYSTPLQREFAPKEITLNTNAINTPRFPIRTTACVNREWMNSNDVTSCNLFGNANVGFHYLNEIQSDKNCRHFYRTNIKWIAANDAKGTYIRQAFFDEIMWLLKNKAVMEGCSMNFKFYFTYPQSMDNIQELFNLWKKARENVKAGDVANNMQLNAYPHPVESVVPWYYQRKQGLVDMNDNYMNVDIGGGTMDILYYDHEARRSYTYSARFAANDLWGDGLDEQSANRKNNAFIKDYQPTLANLADTLQKKYEGFASNAEDSSDIISFLFKYDNEFNFSSHLNQSPLMRLLLMHAVSVAYYIGLILQKEEFEVPDKMTFTGMGSLYLKNLCPIEQDIEKLIKSVLRYQGIQGADNMKITLVNNPKVVTARGGVVFHHHDNSFLHEEHNVWGYAGEGPDDNLRTTQVKGKKGDVMKLIDNFFDYFTSKFFTDMQDTVNASWKNISFSPSDKSVLQKLAANSFESWYTLEGRSDADRKQKDALFFWPLKDLFFYYGLELKK